MRILHTSDWHAGRLWKSQDRLSELQDVLEHLGDFIEHERIDLVLMSGDVFESQMPAPEAERAVSTILQAVGTRRRSVRRRGRQSRSSDADRHLGPAGGVRWRAGARLAPSPHRGRAHRGADSLGPRRLCCRACRGPPPDASSKRSRLLAMRLWPNSSTRMRCSESSRTLQRAFGTTQ